MEIKDEEKKFEQRCEEVKDKVVRQNILLIYNKISTKKFSEYTIDISIPKNTSPKSKEDYEFHLIINLIKKTQILFSENINPISDGRNLLPIINTNKSKKVKLNFFSLDEIDINQIMKDLTQFLSENNFVNLYGYYYLGEEYSPKIIDNLKNIERIQCNRLDLINGSKIEISALCTISDDYFCLYEKEQNNTNYILVFYSSIKNLLSFNKTLDSIVTLNWKKKVRKKMDQDIYCVYTMKIQSEIDEDMDKVMDILIEKIRKIGYKMNIKEKKKGVLPDVDVEATENEIIRLESQLQNRDNILVYNKLIQSYEKLIEYYSAANDDKYIEYNNKMKELLSNQKYEKYIK